MDDRRERVWRELDALGEAEVRARLAQKIYGPRNISLVQEWLRRQSQSDLDSKESRNIVSNEEQIRIARSAKNAAWVAAIGAIIAAIVAVIALYLSRQPSVP